MFLCLAVRLYDIGQEGNLSSSILFGMVFYELTKTLDTYLTGFLQFWKGNEAPLGASLWYS